MERSEPTLVPEWLKNAGAQNGGGSISHPDDKTASKLARNKSFVNGNSHDSGRSFSRDKLNSSYFRRSSSGNVAGNSRSHSSYGRNKHNRDSVTDLWRHDFSYGLGETFVDKFERDGLRRSQSMVSGKHEDAPSKKVVNGLNTNGSILRGSSVGGVNKGTFERDFPSLGAEERSATPEIGRVSSPGLTSAIESLPIASSTGINGEKWTSALAEVPVSIGSNVSGVSSVQVQNAPSSSEFVAKGTPTSLNMAEAVAQGPSRGQTTNSQLSVGSQKLEELTIKHYNKLIPVRPSTPKALISNSSDKQRTRVGHQPYPSSPSLSVDHSSRGSSVKGDVPKASSMVKLQVLKPVGEKNGIKPVSSALVVPSGTGNAATRGSMNNTGHERKPVMEKQPNLQAQSRKDFFNSVRKKSMASSSSVAVSPSSSSEKSAEGMECARVIPNGDHSSPESMSRDHQLPDHGQKHLKGQDGFPISDPIFSEEEETAFLRSLGWEENSDEGGLTEEEINAFFKEVAEYINSKPSLKILQGVEPKLSFPFGARVAGISSDTKLES